MGKSLSEIIKESRINKNLSQRELADIINVSKSYINKIEHDQTKKPSFEVLSRLSMTLEIDFVELIEISNYDISEIATWQNLYNNIIEYQINKLDEVVEEKYKDKENNIDIQRVLEDYKSGIISDIETICLFINWMKIEDINTDLFLDFIMKKKNKL